MSDDELDRVLPEENIVPSAGFTANVMEALRREASIPPPIPFPWKWALPLFAAAAFMLALLFKVAAAPTESVVTPPPLLMNFIAESRHIGLEWIALALVVTFASVKLSRFSS